MGINVGGKKEIW